MGELKHCDKCKISLNTLNTTYPDEWRVDTKLKSKGSKGVSLTNDDGDALGQRCWRQLGLQMLHQRVARPEPGLAYCRPHS